jgi:hypothetical protein
VGAAGDTEQTEKTPLPRSWWWFGLIVVLYAAFVVISVHIGVPNKLPGVALGAPALLDLERAAAGLVAVAAVVIFAYVTRLGHLPSRPENVASYPATTKQVVHYDQEIARRAGESSDNSAARLVPLEDSATASAAAIALIEPLLAAHHQRLAALENARGKRGKRRIASDKSEPKQLEQLRKLLAGRETEVELWNESSPALRARASASTAILDELAQQPPTAPARQGRGVDVLVSAPAAEWAAGVLLRLREALPDWPAGPLETWRREAVQPGVPGSIVRITVDVPERDGRLPVERVRSALTRIEGVSVDYSEPLDLIVVTPRIGAERTHMVST